MLMKAIVVLSVLAYTAQAGSGSDSTPAPTPDPVGTPYNPSDKVFTGELGSHLASTLMNIKQLLTDGRMSSINKELEDYVIKNTECDPKLGILWVAKGGESPKEPMGLYFNKAGQVAGLRIKIYGEKAAQGRAVSQGYWIPDGKNTWYMSISFRPAEEMCTTSVSKHAIGDRIVINQDTIAKSIPMTLAQAQEVGFMPGSCMKSMGQHWFYDLQDAPGNSWISGNLLPVTPMYHPQTNNLNAFFWSSPLPQGPNNAGASTPFSWDNVPGILGGALPAFAMCENFCSKHCSTGMIMGTNPWESSGTSHWATLHVFFNADPENEPTCPGFSSLANLDNPGAIAMGRTCPSNTAVATNLNLHLRDRNRDDSDDDNSLVAFVVIALVMLTIAVVVAAVFLKRKQSLAADVVECEQLQTVTVQGRPVGSSYNAVSKETPI